MKRYAFTDLHGNYKLFKDIQNYINKDDIVYCLGDNCDRGPDGIKIIQEMLQDSRFHYILGNHEAMLLDAIQKGTINNEFTLQYFDKEDMKIFKHNGTLETLHAYMKLSQEEKKFIVESLSRLPVAIYLERKNGDTIFLSHAGCNPSDIGTLYPDFKFYWDRKHIAKEKWVYNDEDNNLYIIHGHTPVQALPYYSKVFKNKLLNEIVCYCEGHKFDLDVCTPITNKIALFDLDTFEVIYLVDDTKLN